MAIAPVGTAGRLEQDAWVTTTVNVSVVVPSGCELLVLGLARDNGGDNWSLLTSVEVNGSATGVTSQVSSINDAGSQARIWTLVNPTAGTYNATWTWGASSVAGGVYFALPMSGGIDTTDPVSATNSSASGSGSSPFSTSITVESGGVAVAVGRSDDATISAVGSGQTAVGAMTAGGVISYKEDATAMAFSFTGSGAVSQAVIAIRPGGGGSSTIAADQGTFTHTGQTANLLFGRVLAADSGTFTNTGQDATLTKTTAYSITADYGSFSLAGQDVAFQKTDAGSYVLTAEVGLFSLVGQGALASYSMNAEIGSFVIAGQEVAFSIGVPAAYSLTADAGSYSLTGQNARLDWSGAPIVPNRQAGIYMGMRIGL